MLDETWDLVVNDLPQRPVRRAGLLLGVRVADGYAAVIFDPDAREFVRVPGLPQRAEDTLLSLSPDGEQLLLLAEHGEQGPGGLCLHTLATGEQRWFDAEAEGQDWLAVPSPDGGSIATLTVDDRDAPDDFTSIAAVTVIDIGTGRRRRVWATPGGWSAESTVTWSPDGRYLAATYLTMDEESASVIIDSTDGSVRAHVPDLDLLPAPNGTWIGGDVIGIRDSELTLVSAVAPGPPRTLASRVYPMAVLGDRLIDRDPTSRAEDLTSFSTTDLDGNDRRPFVTLRPRADIRLLDVSAVALRPA